MDELGVAAAYVDAGRGDRALEVLGPLLADRPEDPRVARIAVRALLGVGRPADAAEVVERALGAAPGDAGLHVLAALAYSAARRRGPAARAAAEAVRIAPSRWDAHYAVVVVAVRARTVTAEALAAAEQLERLAPDLAATHSVIGWMEAVRRRRSAAASRFHRALQLDPEHVDAQNGLAHLELRGIGRPGAAASWAMRTLRDAPEDRSAQRLLRLAGHRATWLLCLGPMLVAQISWRIVEGDDPSAGGPVVRSQPVLAVLLLLLVPAVIAWAVHLQRTTDGRLTVLLRLIPSMRPELAVWAGCSAVAVLLLGVALAQAPGTAAWLDSTAALLAFVPGLVCILVERRRRARG